MNKVYARLLSFIITLTLITSIGSLVVPESKAYAEPDSSPILSINQTVDMEYGHNNNYTFNYKLRAVDSSCPLPENSENLEWNFELKGDKSQKMQFLVADEASEEDVAAIRFYHTGLYHYILKQNITDRKVNISYDESVYDIFVRVAWTSGPRIQAVWVQRETGEKPDSITFKNTVKKSKVIGDPPVRVVKRIEGNPIKDEKFTFVMTPKQEDFPLPYGAKGEYETYLYGEGEIEIGNIEFDAPGLYEYRVWERSKPSLSYDYDKTVFIVKYNIQEQDDGSLTCDREIIMEDKVETECVFTNIYKGKSAAPKGDTQDKKKASKSGKITTGDAAQMGLYLVIMMLAASAAIAEYLRKLKAKK